MYAIDRVLIVSGLSFEWDGAVLSGNSKMIEEFIGTSFRAGAALLTALKHRDHYTEALEMIKRTGAWPTDSAPEGALESPEYAAKMADYDRRLADATRDTWCSCYLGCEAPKN